jgi:hypothetical protein
MSEKNCICSSTYMPWHWTMLQDNFCTFLKKKDVPTLFNRNKCGTNAKASTMQNHTESVYLKLALTYIYKNNNKNDCLYVHLAIKDNVKKSYYKTNGLKYI